MVMMCLHSNKTLSKIKAMKSVGLWVSIFEENIKSLHFYLFPPLYFEIELWTPHILGKTTELKPDFLHLCSCVGGWVHLCVNVHMSTCVYEDQKTTLGVVPRVLSIPYPSHFEAIYFLGIHQVGKQFH